MILCLALVLIHVAPLAMASTVDLAWAARWTEHGDISDPHMTVDAAGNVYVTATYTPPQGGGSEIVTIKYDSLGNGLWTTHWGSAGNLSSEAKAIGVDAQGNVYVAGDAQFSSNSNDYVTIKYSPDGLQQWVATYPGSGTSTDYLDFWALAVDAAGNVYVTGSSGLGQESEYATVKYDTDGNQLWEARYGGPYAEGAIALDIAVDGASNVYVTGSVRNLTDGVSECAILKYDPDGNPLWAGLYSYGDDVCFHAKVDAAGNVYVAGQSVDPSFSFNFLTVKFDADGHEPWAVTFPDTITADYYVGVDSLGVDAAGNVYITGLYYDIDDNSFNSTTIKYDANGSQVWVHQFTELDPSNINSTLDWMAVDSKGNVYLAGEDNQGMVAMKYDTDGNQLWSAHYPTPASSFTQVNALVLDAAGAVYLTARDMKGGVTTLKFVQSDSAPLPPQVYIKANNSEGPLDLSFGQRLKVALSVVPNGYAGVAADKALCLYNGSRWFSWTGRRWRPGYYLLDSMPLVASTFTRDVGLLPPGSYSLVFAVDDNADGYLDWTWVDAVAVSIR